MQEWLNWHAWKACVPQKGTGGSNPPLSAVGMNASPPSGGLVSILWEVKSELALDEHTIK